MKTLLTSLIILIPFLASFASTIKGTVIDGNYFPLKDIIVHIEGGDSTKSDKNGSFVIPVSKFPYTLTLISNNYQSAVRYEDISTTTPQFIWNTNIPIKNINQTSIDISFPELKEGEHASIQFLSKDPFVSRTRQINSVSDRTSLIVEWQKDRSAIDGYILYVLRSEIKYISYSLIPISINSANSSFKAVINAGSMNNLTTNIVSIDLPGRDEYRERINLYAEFPGYGDIELPIERKDNTYSGIVPQNLLYPKSKINGNLL